MVMQRIPPAFYQDAAVGVLACIMLSQTRGKKSQHSHFMFTGILE